MFDALSVPRAHSFWSSLALTLLASPISILPIGFGDRQLKSVTMVALNFFDGRSIQRDSCAVNLYDSRPMRGSKARRMIPVLCEQLPPLRWRCARKSKRNGIKSTARRAVIPRLCNVFDDHARNLDVLEFRTGIGL